VAKNEIFYLLGVHKISDFIDCTPHVLQRTEPNIGGV